MIATMSYCPLAFPILSLLSKLTLQESKSYQATGGSRSVDVCKCCCNCWRRPYRCLPLHVLSKKSHRFLEA
ncbi:uncharacterized protein EDB93DRAFT_125503 [Suillus bovinus]|uniref:uncharacterized protein n=1 Tax=Suillus bovinus TaxID=48563 RepID=UPI001B8691C5|nr:uncharacterized protein EDB93DRAFT_125503 [Suillus bovinus]KAG2154949.1 hypothetical protein EDB93DRAFT_125503 [Suillus bovinus]